MLLVSNRSVTTLPESTDSFNWTKQPVRGIRNESVRDPWYAMLPIDLVATTVVPSTRKVLVNGAV